MSKRFAAVFAAALVLGLQSGPLQAREFKPAPNMTFTLDFDSEEGTFSVLELKDLGSLNALRATVQIHRLGHHERWAPGFRFSLENGKETIAFEIWTGTRQPPLTMHMEYLEDDKDVAKKEFSKTLELDEKIQIEIEWTAKGKVTVRAGSETLVMNSKAPLTSVKVTGSTGEVEMNPLQFGRMTP